jgi:hypothetical protein
MLSLDVTESEEAGEFPLLTLEALGAVGAWRDKDRMHLRDLIHVGLIGGSTLPSLPDELRPRLEELLAGEQG